MLIIFYESFIMSMACSTCLKEDSESVSISIGQEVEAINHESEVVLDASVSNGRIVLLYIKHFHNHS